MLGAMSITHWMVLICVVALLFGGRNKVSGLMEDFGKGIGKLKSGLREGAEVEAEIRRIPEEKL
jgi:sec-independent protein translocase protein TatA